MLNMSNYTYQFSAMKYNDSDGFENPNNKPRIYFNIIDPKTQKVIDRSITDLDLDCETNKKIDKDLEDLGIDYYENKKYGIAVLSYTNARKLLDAFKSCYMLTKYKSIKIAVSQFFDLIYRFKARNSKDKTVRVDEKKTDSIWNSLHYQYQYSNGSYELLNPESSYIKFNVDRIADGWNPKFLREDMKILGVDKYNAFVKANNIVEVYVYNLDCSIKLIKANDRIKDPNKETLISYIHNFFDMVSKVAISKPTTEDEKAEDKESEPTRRHESPPNPFSVEIDEDASFKSKTTSDIEMYDPVVALCKSIKQLTEHIKSRLLNKYYLTSLNSCIEFKQTHGIAVFMDYGAQHANNGGDLNRYERIVYDMTILGFTRGIDYEFLNERIAYDYSIPFDEKDRTIYIVFYNKESAIKMWHFSYKRDGCDTREEFDRIVRFFDRHSSKE